MKLSTLKSENPFLFGYLMAAFWTNDDDAPSGEYMDTNRPAKMLSKLTRAAFDMARKDCKAFKSQNKRDLAFAGNDEQNGHDFWLTRNRSGAGFWDRDYSKDISKGLTDAAHSFGETDLYAGDFGWLYFSR